MIKNDIDMIDLMTADFYEKAIRDIGFLIDEANHCEDFDNEKAGTLMGLQFLLKETFVKFYPEKAERFLGQGHANWVKSMTNLMQMGYDMQGAQEAIRQVAGIYAGREQ